MMEGSLVDAVDSYTFANDLDSLECTLENIRKAARSPGILDIVENHPVKKKLLR
jgi:hypothetical protein